MATPTNQSVIKAFHMLKSFRAPDEWLTSCELSRRANLPEASGYRLIQTLEKIGAVVRGPRGRYRPGMLLVSLSHNVAIGELLREASREITTALSTRFDLTVHLGLLEGGMVTYIAKVCTPTSLSPNTRPGSQLEAYCSGLGKVLLAALPDDQLDSFILDGDLVALTRQTITDRAALRAELKKVRLLGYAVDDREIRADMRCVAVPIHDADGRTVAAMSATDHALRMTEARQTEVREALLEAAAALERKVFPPSPTLPPSHRRPVIRETAVAGHA
ncbi:MAG TPA: IclR family transcriptional regulator [Rhizomicrobium sp.]|jgi:DNA-binding IclR family transcriptional regulator|nr:IclR family transcriptional regulator [Rhizomicrobium sp.]